jgi:hypothetical protein
MVRLPLIELSDQFKIEIATTPGETPIITLTAGGGPALERE